MQQAKISGRNLEEKSGVTRQTINKERKKLKEMGLIDFKTNGRKTTYYASSEALRDSYLSTWVLGNQIFNKLQTSGIFLDTPNLRFSAKTRTEILLFEFSLKMGMVLTYLFMKAMNVNTINNLSFDGKVSYRLTKDSLVQQWLKKIIDPIRLLTIFRQSLYRIGYQFAIDKKEKEHFDHSSYELTKGSFDELLRGFSSVFPSGYKELKSITDSLPSTSEFWKEEIKTLKKQGKCLHEYNIVSETKGEDSIKRFKCKKCDRCIIISIEDIVTDYGLTEKLNAKNPESQSRCNHQWIKRKGYDSELTSRYFYCPFCLQQVIIPVASKEKLELIEEDVELELGRGCVLQCQDIQQLFHREPDQIFSIQDVIIDLKNKRNTQSLAINETQFTKIVSRILNILRRHDYIKKQDLDGQKVFAKCVRY